MVSVRGMFDEFGVKDLVLYNCLIIGYLKSGDVAEAQCLIHEMTERKMLVTWNMMISCCAHAGDFMEALRLFEQMQMERVRPNEITVVTVSSICTKLGDLSLGLRAKKMVDDHAQRTNLIVQTALLEMYVKCGAVDEERMEYDMMGIRDVLIWSAMIAGYAQNGRLSKVLGLFGKMKLEDFKPNEVTLVSVLSACVQLGSVEVMQCIGRYKENDGLAYVVYVGSAVIDMYSKCGNVKRARHVFAKMHKREIVSWNSTIGGLAVDRYAKDAIHLYQQMKGEHFEPNDITFMGLLTMCTHAGLIKLGPEFFISMKENYKIVPKVEHCACIVDLLGRTGRSEDAYELVGGMEVVPNVVIWEHS